MTRTAPLALLLLSCGGSLHDGPSGSPTSPPSADARPAVLAASTPAASTPAASTPAASAPASGVPAGSPPAAGAPVAPVGSAPVVPAAAPVMATMKLPRGGEVAWQGPADSGARRLTVYLHGMCATGPLECPVFAGASGAGWLVCPDGPARCDGAGALWSGAPRAVAAQIEEAVAAVAAGAGAALDGPRALVGYSLGAPSALVQAMQHPGRYDRLMIVNASVEPSAAQLRQAGVTRVALVSGERDATAGKLRAAAARLERAGVDARFFALPATGHYFDAASAERMSAPLGWLLGA